MHKQIHLKRVRFERRNKMENKESQNENVIHEEFDYDGIVEHDNPPPKWIMYILYISIIFSFTYMGYYMAKENAIIDATQSTSPVAWSDYNYDAEVIEGSAQKQNSAIPAGNPLTGLTDAATIIEGEKIYGSNCAACHGAKAVGLVGPTLIDNYTLTAPSIAELTEEISDGTPENGMPGWTAILGEKKIHKVMAYIFSLNSKKSEAVRETNEVPPMSSQGISSLTGDSKKGEKLYSTNCVSCHGTKAVGGFGPALTRFTVADAAALNKSIALGVSAKGMPGWKASLGDQKIADISAYLISLKK